MPETTFDTRITLTDAGRAAVYSPALPIEAEAICADCGADCCDCVCSLYPSREQLNAMQKRNAAKNGKRNSAGTSATKNPASRRGSRATSSTCVLRTDNRQRPRPVPCSSWEPGRKEKEPCQQ